MVRDGGSDYPPAVDGLPTDELLDIEVGGLRAAWRETRPGPGGLKAWALRAWLADLPAGPCEVLTAASAGSHQLAALVRLRPPGLAIHALLHPEAEHPRRRQHLALAAPGLDRVELLPSWRSLPEARARWLAEPTSLPRRWLPPGGTLEAALRGLRAPARAIAARAREVDADHLVLPAASGLSAAALGALLAHEGLELPLHAITTSPRRVLNPQLLRALSQQARQRLGLRPGPAPALHRAPREDRAPACTLELEPLYGRGAFAWGAALPPSARTLLILTHEPEPPAPAAPLPASLEGLLRRGPAG